MSQNTKHAIKKRNLAQQRANRTKDKDDWRYYKKLRNKVTNILRKEKKLWQSNKLVQFGKDTSSIWKNVKSWLGWSSGGPPTKLMSNGNIYSKPKELASMMNSFFINKVRLLRENLPRDAGDPLILVKKLMQHRTCSFSFKGVHPDQISKIISNLKTSKSCGTDDIDTYIVKLAQAELVPVITHVVNLSITQPIFPAQWKTAKTIPLHKKNEKMYMKNYRPVSLLPIYSKILERAVFCQVIEYMESNQLIHPSHHGFRAKHNTSTALLEMFDGWLEAFDNDDITAVIMLDLSAAFDVVDHKILLDKLNLYGFESKEILWMQSYLTGRSQQVYVDGALSDPLLLEAGVPQGSILGPLLYIIFTNDLPEVVHDHLSENNTFYNSHCKSCGSLCCFADDSTYSKSDKDVEKLKDDIKDKFNDISNYMSRNKLVLNSEKTHLLIMSSSMKHKKYDNFGIVLDTGQEMVEPVDNEKLLGCSISNNFKYDNHIRDNEKSMIKILNSRINALRKTSYIATFKTRKMIAEGIIMSNILYIITVYGSCSNYLLSLLQVVQNSAARCVTRLPWNTRVSVLLGQCGWMSVRQLVLFHTMVLTFKIKKDKKPEYLYKKMSCKFNYETRLASGNAIRTTEKIESDARRRSFVPRSTREWNAMPVKLRIIETVYEFKKELRTWILQNHPG